MGNTPRISIRCRACNASAVSDGFGINFKHLPSCPFHPDSAPNLSDEWANRLGAPLLIGVESDSVEAQARAFAQSALLLIESIPRENIGVIRQQLKKSCQSIPSNISEGLGRKRRSAKDCNRFFSIALGSAKEALTQFGLLRVMRPGFAAQIDGATQELEALIKSIEQESSR